MAQIYSKQIIFSGSMFIQDDGYFYGGRWPQLGDEYVIKDYVDSLVSGSVANSGSFYSLLDTPNSGTEGRILFEGESPSIVQDSGNFRILNDNYFYIDLGIIHLSSYRLNFQSINSDETEIGYFSRQLTQNEIDEQKIPVQYKSIVELKAKHQDLTSGVNEEVILFSRFVE